MREGGVPRSREAECGGESEDVELGVLLDHRQQPLVLVLVDQDDAEGVVRLVGQGGQQARRLRSAADRADDEVPRREGRVAHRE